jgi:transposase-like protein
MNEQTVVEKKRNGPPRGAGAKKMRRYSAAEKLRAVRLHLEEGFTQDLVCQELDLGKSTLVLWLQAYRLGGEAGLEPRYKHPRQPKLPAPITEKIVELKQQNPTFGIKRISQVLRRCFFLPASPETVRQLYGRRHRGKLLCGSSVRHGLVVDDGRNRRVHLPQFGRQ